MLKVFQSTDFVTRWLTFLGISSEIIQIHLEYLIAFLMDLL